jgi:hypothetical protein
MEELKLIDFKIPIGSNVYSIDCYLISKGWKQISCFNDYKYVWINEAANKTIVAKIDMIDNGFDECAEIINQIWYFEGIYSEVISEESKKRFFEEMNKFLSGLKKEEIKSEEPKNFSLKPLQKLISDLENNAKARE